MTLITDPRPCLTGADSRITDLIRPALSLGRRLEAQAEGMPGGVEEYPEMLARL